MHVLADCGKNGFELSREIRFNVSPISGFFYTGRSDRIRDIKSSTGDIIFPAAADT
jgi:hypothetical protein